MVNMGIATGFWTNNMGASVDSTTVEANTAPCHRQWDTAAARVAMNTMVETFLLKIFL